MSSRNSNQGISVLGLLGVAFVVLKLTNVINWSWWYVTLPFYGPLGLVIVILAVYFAGLGIAFLVNRKKK